MSYSGFHLNEQNKSALINRMKAYPLELRQRILDAVDNHLGTYAEIAEMRHYTEHMAHDLNRYDQARVGFWETGARGSRCPTSEQVTEYCEQRVPIDPRVVRRLFGEGV